MERGAAWRHGAAGLAGQRLRLLCGSGAVDRLDRDVSPSVPAPAPGVWSVGGSLFVGRTGKGTLAIADGAVVRDSNGFVGQEAGSAGVVTVSGPGSA